MTISKNSKRLQLTLNADKEKEKVILDYLSQSFNETQEIKRILFEYIVNQNGAKVVKNTKSKKKLPKESKSKSKKVNESKSDKKALTNTQNDTKVLKGNGSNTKLVKETHGDTKSLKDSKSKLKKIKDNNDDIQLDLSQFTDEVVEAKSNNKANKSDELKAKKLKALQQFI